MQKSIERGLMELAWRLVPNRRRVLEGLGKTPPVLKGPLLERIARVGLDVARYRGTDELPTNFAINGPIVWIPIAPVECISSATLQGGSVKRQQFGCAARYSRTHAPSLT
jgi:hypothetical protein